MRNAFASEREIAAAQWVWIPAGLSLDGIRDLFADQDLQFGRSMINSAVVPVAQTLTTVGISAMAGYELAQIGNRLDRIVLALTLLTLMVPAAVTFVPSFVLVSSLGWISSLKRPARPAAGADYLR